MRLTSFTDYSLRVLLYVAAHNDRFSTISEIQEYFDISRGHLMKIVHLLSSEGYLNAVRGRSGGIKLGCAPDNINLGELVRLTEPDFRLVECFGRDNNCVISNFCKLPGPFNLALDSFLGTLDGHSLADMMISRNDFGQAANTPKLTKRGPSFEKISRP